MHLSVSSSNPDDVFRSTVPRLATDFLRRRIPSFYCWGLRLFDRGLSCLPDKRNHSLFKYGFPRFIANFERFLHIFPIAEISGNSWVAILSNPSLKKFCSVFLANSPRLIPDHSSASFPIMSLCVPQIVQLVLNQKQYAEVARQLLEKTDTFLTSPPSILLAKIYVKVLAIRIEKAPESDRDAMAMDAFRNWVEKRLPESDCYALSDLILDWCVTAVRLHGLGPLTSYLTSGLFVRGVRFFPVFVGVCKFLKTRINGQSPEVVETLKRELKAAAQAMECRAHGLALAHVLDGRNRKALLNLAAFDVDSPESEAACAAWVD
jgi:hypothetical protein